MASLTHDHAAAPARPWGRLHWRRPNRREALGLTGLTVVAAVMILMLVFQWNWLRGPLAGVISSRLHRPVAITGNLVVHPWSLSPSATVEGLTIGNPAWANPANGPPDPMTVIPRLTVQIRLPRLLIGQVVLQTVRAERPRVHLVRDATGRANWMFGDPRLPGRPLKLPAIRHFVIDDGALTINDARRHLTFVGTVSSNERAAGPQRGVFSLTGSGRLNGERFAARVTGGPLLNVSPDRPYAFNAHVEAGATRVDARGVIPHPFDLGQVSAALAISGPDASRLYPLTGLALPNTPPYRVAGRFSRDGNLYGYHQLTGRVGDSDLSGDLTVRTGRARPLLTADLTSRRLDFDDLAAIFGGPPSTAPGETASPEQRAMGARLRAQGRLLADAPLNLQRLRTMDAKVHYRALSITSPMPVRAMDLTVDLNAGVLKADPLRLTLSRGSLAGSITLDARGATPKQALDLRLTGARLEDLIPGAGGANPALSGALFARARLASSGNSMREAASHANGSFSLVTPRGHIRQAFAELMGINATKGLFLLLSHDRSESDVRCGVADFTAANGVLTARRIVFDTDVVLAQGAGVIDLRNERLDLRLTGKAKHFRLVRIMAPITLKGSLASPAVGIDAGKAAGQITLAGVLGMVAAPLAAVLPFIDPGLAHDADCAALISGGRVAAPPARR